MARNKSTDAFEARRPTSDVDPRATIPRTLRMQTGDELRRGIANFAVYRAVIERLGPPERFRMETQFGDYEMSRSEFESSFPSIVETESYTTGSPSMRGRCYYVQGPPPAGADRFLVT